ncbi:33819_t:CDS:2 [Gigaspora margarita]|uniref:33819_t:CDS:1 n=1 Tax=Gigaspora margarita TaxID=4874 RepID=A0ABN7VXF5_GIGMA|nr:33819_t:CDS:2 [Gigaspora margarita]
MDTSILLEAKEIELSLKESEQLAQTLSNQSMISLVAKIKTDLYKLLQPVAIDIKFSPENLYLVQQQSANFHEWTQVIDDMKTQLETNSNTNRGTLDNIASLILTHSNSEHKQKTLQNEVLNSGQLNKDNDESVRELDEHTKKEAKLEKEIRIEIA